MGVPLACLAGSRLRCGSSEMSAALIGLSARSSAFTNWKAKNCFCWWRMTDCRRICGCDHVQFDGICVDADNLLKSVNCCAQFATHKHWFDAAVRL